MSLAAVTAKIRGVACHLGRADTGGLFCGRHVDTNVDESLRSILLTWRPEEVTCKKCLARYRAWKKSNEDAE